MAGTNVAPQGTVRAFAGAAGLVLVALAAALNLWAGGQRFWLELSLSDFQRFHAQGEAWNAGAALYTTWPPNLNAPLLTMTLFSVLARLSLAAGGIAWMALSAASLMASAAVLRREMRWTWTRLAWPVVLLFAIFSTQITIAEGQLTWLLLLPVTLAWQALRQGHQLRAGAWLGLAIAAKPPVALMALLLPWTALLTAGVLSAGLTVLGILWAGWPTWAAWLSLSGRVDWIDHPFNASLWGAATRMAGVDELRELPMIATAGVLTVAAVLVWQARRTEDADRRFTMAGLFHLLLSPLGWPYYLPLCFAPATAAWSRTPAALPVVVLMILPIPLPGALQTYLHGLLIIAAWAATTIDRRPAQTPELLPVLPAADRFAG